MTVSQLSPSAATPAIRPAPRAALLAVTLTQFGLMLAATVILGRAINWPASLQQSPAQVLPLIHAQAGAVLLGYGSYFLSAFLLMPLAILVRAALAERHGDSAFLGLTTALGVLAGVLKLFGIGRWLFLMPALAGAYLNADAAGRGTIALIYEAFNRYAGGVGELLGVQLFAGVWTLLVSLALLGTGRSRPLAVMGLVSAALLLAGLGSLVGLQLGPILLVQGVLWQLWLVALAVTLWRARR